MTASEQADMWLGAGLVLAGMIMGALVATFSGRGWRR